MVFDRFLIAPINGGLQTDTEPWLIPDDAFERLDNAYIYKGRVRKRFGSTTTGTGAGIMAPMLSRVRIPLPGGAGVGTTDASGYATGIVPGVIFKVGQMFSVANTIFTVTAAGAAEQMLRTDSHGVAHNLPGGPGVGETDGAGAAAGIVAANYFVPNVLGARFNIGGEIFTVTALGSPAAMVSTGGGAGIFDTATGAYTFAGCAIGTQIVFYPHIAHYNTVTGAFTIAGATPATQVYFYSSEPIMGLTLHEVGAVIEHDAYAFDRQFAYQYVGGSWNRVGAAVWHGSNSQFFWATNWNGANSSDIQLFVTNYNAVKAGVPGVNDDPLYSFTGGVWTAFVPKFLVAGVGNTVKSCRIVIPFKDRLLLLNTIESNAADNLNSHFPARCRYSHNGSPFPAAGAAWYEHNQVGWDGAGWIDASTDEEIISAEFIKDRLIVYFERSTWELVYTGNQVQPFIWQKINTELGSVSTFSSVPFDKHILTIGGVGVHACSGGNVVRIDEKIPKKIFDLRSENNGIERVFGVRDYYAEMVYWTFPQYGGNVFSNVFPNKVLAYNYENHSWAMNDDCFTVFGYFEQQDDTTWATAPFAWAELGYTWQSGVTQADFRQVIAGNQEGSIVIVSPDFSRNAPAMSLSNAVYAANVTTLTIESHTLQNNDYIYIENGLEDLFPLAPVQFELNGEIHQVTVVDAHTVTIGDVELFFPYLGGATVTRVSNFAIKSKQLNPYINKAKNVLVSKIDFAVQKTEYGSVVVDYYPSSSNISLVTDGEATGAIVGDNILETAPYDAVPLEASKQRLWHTVYFQGDGECIQLFIRMNHAQMSNPLSALSDFQLEGMLFYTSPSGGLQ